MRKVILLILLVLVSVGFTEATTRCEEEVHESASAKVFCGGKWDGFFSQNIVSKNSIYVSWSSGGSGASFRVWYAKVGSDDWKFLDEQTNRTAKVRRLQTATRYKLRVVRTCPEDRGFGPPSSGLNNPNRYIEIIFKTDGKVLRFCTGIFTGANVYKASNHSITLYWTETDGKYNVRRRYISGGGSIWDNPSKDWVTVETNMTGNSVTVKGLRSLATYEIEITLLCEGREDQIKSGKYTTTRVGYIRFPCNIVKNLHTKAISHNSAEIDGEFHWVTKVEYTWVAEFDHIYYSTYDIKVWETNDPTKKAVINRQLAAPMSLVINPLLYDYFVIGADSKVNDPPLKPNTDYSYVVIHNCFEDDRKSQLYAPPGIMTFRTLPAPTGACGCTIGNKTVSSATNSAATHFYCGNVVGAATIAESSATTTFRGATVELNPGFETHISGTGSFVAVAFDPNTCQESAAAVAQKGQKSVSKMAAPDNSLSNTSIAAPKKYKVYPNPNRGSFSIDFREKESVIKSITVYDMFGVRILHKRYNRTLDVEQYSLRLAKSGLYKIAIRSASGVAYETLLVEF